MNGDIQVSAQCKFGEGGEMEVEETTETDLADWGLVDPGPERETKVMEEQASEFGVDDRAEQGEVQAGEQSTLFVDRDEDQMDLTGQVGGREAKYGD